MTVINPGAVGKGEASLGLGGPRRWVVLLPLGDGVVGGD